MLKTRTSLLLSTLYGLFSITSETIAFDSSKADPAMSSQLTSSPNPFISTEELLSTSKNPLNDLCNTFIGYSKECRAKSLQSLFNNFVDYLPPFIEKKITSCSFKKTFSTITELTSILLFSYEIVTPHKSEEFKAKYRKKIQQLFLDLLEKSKLLSEKKIKKELDLIKQKSPEKSSEQFKKLFSINIPKNSPLPHLFSMTAITRDKLDDIKEKISHIFSIIEKPMKLAYALQMAIQKSDFEKTALACELIEKEGYHEVFESIEKASKHLEEEINGTEGIPQKFYKLGISFFEKQQWDRAIFMLRNAFILNHSMSQHMLGLAYQRLGEKLYGQNKITEAIKAFEAASELDNPEGTCNVGFCWIMLEKYLDAIPWLEHVNPSDLNENTNFIRKKYLLISYLTIGGHELNKRRYEQATEWYTKALELEEFPEQEYLVKILLIGINYEQSSNWDQALFYYKQAHIPPYLDLEKSLDRTRSNKSTIINLTTKATFNKE